MTTSCSSYGTFFLGWVQGLGIRNCNVAVPGRHFQRSRRTGSEKLSMKRLVGVVMRSNH